MLPVVKAKLLEGKKGLIVACALQMSAFWCKADITTGQWQNRAAGGH